MYEKLQMVAYINIRIFFVKKFLCFVVCIFTFLNGAVECENSKPYIVFYKTVSISDKQCLIEASYPQIKNSHITGSLTKFNNIIDNYVKEKINIFKFNYNKALKESNYILPGPWRFKIRSDVYLNTSKKISVLFSGDVFMAATHSQQFYSSYNFDFGKGRELELKDLFKNHSNYLDIISKYCIDKLSQKFIQQETRQSYKSEVLDNIEIGASAKEENYRCFYMTSDGIVIVFHPYQVAAYAAGAQKVLIPYKILNTILLPEYMPYNVRQTCLTVAAKSLRRRSAATPQPDTVDLFSAPRRTPQPPRVSPKFTVWHPKTARHRG